MADNDGTGVMAVAATPLARRLAEASQKPDALEAFRVARAWFVAGKRIDMQDLAAELGISRATLFRWVGNRNELIGEVVWSLGERAMAQVVPGVRGRGADRIATIMERFCRELIAADFMRSYLSREPEAGLRLLTTRASVVQRRMVAAVDDLLREEVDRGAIDPPIALHDLAYLLVRIAESFNYADLITGEPPDATKVGAAVRALLSS